MKTRESFKLTAIPRLIPCFLLYLQVGCATAPPTVSEQHRLQGYWEGEGPGGKIAITITGNSLHFYARPDFWFDTTISIPAGTDPQQLQATIQDCSPPTKSIGQVVFAIFKIEDGTLTLAVNDGSDTPPTTFAEALSHYNLEKVGAESATAIRQ